MRFCLRENTLDERCCIISAFIKQSCSSKKDNTIFPLTKLQLHGFCNAYGASFTSLCSKLIFFFYHWIKLRRKAWIIFISSWIQLVYVFRACILLFICYYCVFPIFPPIVDGIPSLVIWWHVLRVLKKNYKRPIIINN